MNSEENQNTSKKIWHKTLFENHGLPDNYIDELFFDDIKRNVNVKTYNLVQVIKESTIITQQFSCVVLLVIIYYYMANDMLASETLIIFSSLIVLTGYIFNLILFKRVTIQSVLKDIRSTFILTLLGFGFSPILSTLTKSISTDTIYAMVFFMLIGNLLFHDYGTTAPVVSQSISLNMAIFASVCLASRLSTFIHTFSIILTALAIFGLWPLMRRNIKERSINTQLFVCISISLLTVFALSKTSFVATIFFILGHLFIIFVCPAWLIHLQQYKDNLNGPWDEALISESQKNYD